MTYTKLAFLSALGSIGKRHLAGLVEAGFYVHSIDPNPSSFLQAKDYLQKLNLDKSKLIKMTNYEQRYKVAIFSETTLHRLKNFKNFLSNSSAEKFYLEKPLSNDLNETYLFLKLAEKYDLNDKMEVNLIRRQWPHIKKIKELCDLEEEFTLTVNGGSLGIGCNGIHFIDNLIHFSNGEHPKIKWVEIYEDRVNSGRGEKFIDFGGNFILKTNKGTLFCSLSSKSSSNVIMTIRGKHFISKIDYQNKIWEISKRQDNCELPFYRYGSDYVSLVEESLYIPEVSSLTRDWSLDKIEFPKIDTAMITHKILFNLLKKGNIIPPYTFT